MDLLCFLRKGWPFFRNDIQPTSHSVVGLVVGENVGKNVGLNVGENVGNALIAGLDV